MSNEEVTLRLKLHDAKKLLETAEQKSRKGDPAWRPYWLRVARDLRVQLDRQTIEIDQKYN